MARGFQVLEGAASAERRPGQPGPRREGATPGARCALEWGTPLCAGCMPRPPRFQTGAAGRGKSPGLPAGLTGRRPGAYDPADGRPPPLRRPARDARARPAPRVGRVRPRRPPRHGQPPHARRVLGAAAPVRTGEMISLDLPLDLPDPPLFGRQPYRHEVFALSRNEMDDRLDDFHLQGSTQWDALGHVRCREHGFWGGRTTNPTNERQRPRHRALGRARHRRPGRAASTWPAGRSRRAGRSTRSRPTDDHRRRPAGRARPRRASSCESGDILLRAHRLGRRLPARSTRPPGQPTPRTPPSPGCAPTRQMARFLWDAHAAAVVLRQPRRRGRARRPRRRLAAPPAAPACSASPSARCSTWRRWPSAAGTDRPLDVHVRRRAAEGARRHRVARERGRHPVTVKPIFERARRPLPLRRARRRLVGHRDGVVLVPPSRSAASAAGCTRWSGRTSAPSPAACGCGTTPPSCRGTCSTQANYTALRSCPPTPT